MINGRKEWAVGIGDAEREKGIIVEESFRTNFLWVKSTIDRKDHVLF